MSNPVCSVHQKPMRLGAKGEYFCASVLSTNQDGSKNWCKERVAPPKAPTPSQIPSTNGIGTDSSLAAAALGFAGNLCRGAGPDFGDTAIALAIKAYSALRAVQS